MNCRSLIRLAGFFVAFSISSTYFGVAQARPVGRVRNIRPVVEVRNGEKGAWAKTKERHYLEPGQYFRANPTGKAELVFNDGSSITLNSRAILHLEGDNTPAKPLGLRLVGAFAQIVVRSKGSIEIRAAAGVAAPQGTEYMVSLTDENTMVVTVSEGSVRFFNEKGQVTVGANQQSTAKVGQAPTTPVAVDASGLMQWAFDVSALPVEFEMLAAPTGDLATLEARATANPNDSATQKALGQARLLSGDANGAAEAFTRAVQLTPTDPTAHVALAVAQLARNDLNAARTALQNAPDGALTQAARGLVALRANDLAAAQSALEDAARRDPKLSQAHSLLALTLLSQNKTAEAVAAGRRAIAVAPTSAQAQASLSLALFYASNAREAAKAASQAVRLNPESPFALLAQGQALLASQKTDAARAAFIQAEALAPQLPIVQLNLATAYTRLDMPKRAEKYYRRVLQASPNSAAAHTGLGATLLAAGRDKDALPELRRALEIEPNNALARANMAAYYIEMGDFTAAGKELQNLADDPTSGFALIKLSEAALFKQKLFEAQEYARKAVKLLPDSARAHYQLGRVYRELEHTVQAEQEFRQAVILDPNFADARFALGLAREVAEQGGDFNRPLSAIASNASGPRQALNIQNLQTPGAEDRIQAAIQDPAVIDSASRAFGNTQIEGRIGEDNTNNVSLSHLQGINRERGALGIGVSRDHTNGIRENADLTEEKAGFSFGTKQQDNPSGFFALGQWNRRRFGDNVGASPQFPGAEQRTITELPNLLFGYNLQKTERTRTRFFVQFDRPSSDSLSIDESFGSSLDGRSAHVEVRHDAVIGKHRLALGASTGQRRFVTQTFVDTPFFQQKLLLTNRLRPTQLFLRDELSLSHRLSVTGEMRVVRLGDNRTFEVLESTFPLPPSPPIDRTLTRGVPNFIVNYKPDQASMLRLRARRVFNPVADFGLLSPNDEFLISFGDEIESRVDGGGRSFEVEYSRTFDNTSFLTISVFHQKLKNINRSAIETFSDAKLRGARFRYEGVITPHISYFVNGKLNSHNATLDQSLFGLPDVPNYEFSLVPRVSAEAGIQLLSNNGWFVQPSLGFIGSRRLPSDPFLGTPRTRLGSFSLANVRMGKRSGLRSTVFVEVSNLFDKTYVSPGTIADGELQPGRQIRVGAAWRF